MKHRFAMAFLACVFANAGFLFADAPEHVAPEPKPATAEPKPVAPAAEDKPPATHPATKAATAPEVSADKLLGEMLTPPPAAVGKPIATSDAPPAIDLTSGRNAIKPSTQAVAVMREGTFLVDRLGRLTRSADGNRMEFTFESDGAAMQDPPVIIVPNLKLMAMEDVAKTINRDLRYRITGMVTEYRGRNYILLDKAVVVPDATQQYRRTQQ